MKPRRKLVTAVAALLAGLLAAGVAVFATSPASAADIKDQNYAGALALDPAAGGFDTVFNISTTKGCPEGFQVQARVFVVDEGSTTAFGTLPPLSLTPDRFEGGLDAPISISGRHNMFGGIFENAFREFGIADTDVLLACESDIVSSVDPLGTVAYKYFAAHVVWNNTDFAYKVVKDKKHCKWWQIRCWWPF